MGEGAMVRGSAGKHSPENTRKNRRKSHQGNGARIAPWRWKPGLLEKGRQCFSLRERAKAGDEDAANKLAGMKISRDEYVLMNLGFLPRSQTETTSELVNEVFRQGGWVWSELGAQEQICLDLPRKTGWLIEEIRRGKPKVIAELKARCLQPAVPTWKN